MAGSGNNAKIGLLCVGVAALASAMGLLGGTLYRRTEPEEGKSRVNYFITIPQSNQKSKCFLDGAVHASLQSILGNMALTFIPSEPRRLRSFVNFSSGAWRWRGMRQGINQAEQ